MRVLGDLFKDYRFAISFTILCVLLVFAGLSFFSPYDPTVWGVVPRDQPPSSEYWWGPIPRGRMSFGKRRSPCATR